MSSAGRTAYADANLFIALLAGPDHSLHENALDLFRRVADGELELIVTPVIVAELIYVARPALGWSRSEAAGRITDLLQSHGIVVREQAAVTDALQLYLHHNKLDFADAYLAATALEAGVPVASFDPDFAKVDGLETVAA